VASNSGTSPNSLFRVPSLFHHPVRGVDATSVLADLRKRLIGDQGCLCSRRYGLLRCRDSALRPDSRYLEYRAGLGPISRQGGKALVAAANKDQPCRLCLPLFKLAVLTLDLCVTIDRVKTEKVGLLPTDLVFLSQVYRAHNTSTTQYLGRTYEVIGQVTALASHGARHLTPQLAHYA